MWKRHLCLSLNSDFGISEEEQIKLLKKVGFDGFFPIGRKRRILPRCGALRMKTA